MNAKSLSNASEVMARLIKRTGRMSLNEVKGNQPIYSINEKYDK